MNYYLIVYNRRHGRLVMDREYGHSQRGQALTARFAQERLHRGDPDIEVVVLGSESREALVQTHSRYFKSLPELTESDR